MGLRYDEIPPQAQILTPKLLAPHLHGGVVGLEIERRVTRRVWGGVVGGDAPALEASGC